MSARQSQVALLLFLSLTSGKAFGQTSSRPDRHPSSTAPSRHGSSHWKDISRYEIRYWTSKELTDTFGIPWGASYSDLRWGKLVGGYRLQTPSLFFSQSHWSLPEWEHSFRQASSVSPNGWSPGNAPNTLHYLYEWRATTQQETVRILELSRTSGLQTVYDYYADGLMRVTKPEKNRVTRLRQVPTEFGDLSWASAWTPETRGTRKLIDPKRFFTHYGRAFVDWRNSFGKAEYVRADHWVRDGHRYSIYVDDNWKERVEERLKPPFHILEYSDSGLTGIYEYDERWTERELRPVLLTSALGRTAASTGTLPDLWRDFPKKHPQELRVIAVSLLALLIVVWTAVRRQRKVRKIQKEERLKELERSHKLQYERDAAQEKLKKEQSRQADARALRKKFREEISQLEGSIKRKQYQNAALLVETLAHKYPGEEAALSQARMRLRDAKKKESDPMRKLFVQAIQHFGTADRVETSTL